MVPSSLAHQLLFMLQGLRRSWGHKITPEWKRLAKWKHKYWAQSAIIVSSQWVRFGGISGKCTSSAKISLDVRTVDMASNLLLANLGNSFGVSKQYMLANIQYMWHNALNCNIQPCQKYLSTLRLLSTRKLLTAEALHYIRTHYNCGIYGSV